MLRTLLAAAAMALLAPSAALAVPQPDTVVDFERVPVGDTLNDQYVSPEGVDFGRPEEFGLPPFGNDCPIKVAGGGITGRSAEIACAVGGLGDVTDPHIFNAAFEFNVTRRRVQFKLRNATPENDSRFAAEVRFYDPSGTVLNAQTVSFPSAASVVPVTYTHPTARIASVWIQQTNYIERTDDPDVYLDDIAAAKDETPPDPEFALALTTPTVSAVEGDSVTAGVSVRRFNGSSGGVTLNVSGGLPAGIANVGFNPKTVVGTNPSMMTVTADKPVTGSRQITIVATGSAGTGTAARNEVTQTVLISPAVTLDNRETATLIRGCGFQPVADSFAVRGNYSGQVTVGPTGALTGPASLRVPSPKVNVGGNGQYSFAFELDPGTATGGGTYNVRTSPAGATEATHARSYTIGEVSVDSATGPTGTSIIRPLVPGPVAVVTGNFPTACPVKFVDQHSVEWPIVERHRVEVGGSGRDLITLQAPVLATSGPLSVVSTTSNAEVAKTPPLDVVDFRNVSGSVRVNSGSEAGAPDYHWEEFRTTFVNDDVDRCFLGICGRDPVAEKYHQQFLAWVTSYPGMCAGFSIMATRFFGVDGIRQTPASYQAGAARAWDITNTADGTPWKRDLVRWAVSQNDKGFGDARRAATARSAADERNVLRDALARRGAAYIAIRQGTAGHAVVAYAMQENQPAIGTERGPVTVVRIYDPNLPYQTAEENTTPTRNTNQGMSTLRIDADGAWSGAGFPWSGGNGTLGVVPQNPAENATLPTSSFLVFFEIGPAATKVTQIKADGKPALDEAGEPQSGSGVTLDSWDSGVKAVPRYGLDPGQEYEASVLGTKAGEYTQGQFTSGAVATAKTTTAPGQVDTLTVTPDKPVVGLVTGADKTNVEYDVADRLGKATRAAEVEMSASKGGGDEVSLTAGAVKIAHDGPTTGATVTLTSVGEGIPTTVTAAPVSVADGQRLEMRPRSWADVGAGARYVVRNRRGRVVRRGKARLRGAKGVSIKRVRAKLRKGTVTVSGQVGKRGSAPLLAAVVEFRRGGKVVKRKGATLREGKVKAGAFSLPIKVGKAPKGTRARVIVTLGDEAAEGSASARKEVRVRR